MSRDLRNLINGVEEEGKNVSELEHVIDNLKEEINRLKLTIEEKEFLIKQNKASLKDKEMDVPEDIKILKDMVISQRQELSQKEHEIETSKNYNAEIENVKNIIIQLQEQIELYRQKETNTNKLVDQLIEKNDTYRTDIEMLKTQLKKTKSEPSKPVDSQELTQVLEKIENLKLEKEDFRSQIINLKQKLKEIEKVPKKPIVKNGKEEIAKIENFIAKAIEKKEKSLAPITNLKQELKEIEKIPKKKIFKPEQEEIPEIKKPIPRTTEEKEDISELFKMLETSSQMAESIYEESSSVIPKIKTEKVEFTVAKSFGRRKCPKCGNFNKAHIFELEDKTNIIMSYPKMYGKKFRCGACGCEWRYKNYT